MTEIIVKPIGIVHNCRTEPVDDQWASVESVIELCEDLPDACFDGIEQFSHLEVIFYFNKSEKTVTGSEHPREQEHLPKTGIFAQRKKDRPNHLGTTFVRLIRHEGRRLFVENLDAIDGSPVIDIKPVFEEYLPLEKIRQPEWTREIMKNYW